MGDMKVRVQLTLYCSEYVVRAYCGVSRKVEEGGGLWRQRRTQPRRARSKGQWPGSPTNGRLQTGFCRENVSNDII
jgi:hypothetical protein